MANVFLWNHVIHAPISNIAGLAALDVTLYVNGGNLETGYNQILMII